MGAELMKKDLLVIGGGGHAKVVIDLALRSGAWRIAGVLDDAARRRGKSVLGCEVLGGTERISDYSGSGMAFVVAIGSNAIRERLQATATSAGLVAATLVHPSAVLAESVEIGDGAVVMAGAVVNADARIGKGVDREYRVPSSTTIVRSATFVTLHRASSCAVQSRSVLGPSSAWALQSYRESQIGSDCVIGAGAAVVSPVSSGARVVGVPAKSTDK